MSLAFGRSSVFLFQLKLTGVRLTMICKWSSRVIITIGSVVELGLYMNDKSSNADY